MHPPPPDHLYSKPHSTSTWSDRQASQQANVENGAKRTFHYLSTNNQTSQGEEDEEQETQWTSHTSPRSSRRRPLPIWTSPSCKYVDSSEEQDPTQPDPIVVFLRTIPTSFRADDIVINHVRTQLATKGFDSILALSKATLEDLEAAGMEHATDRSTLFHQARAHQSRQPPLVLPDLKELVTVSKFLTLCGIPRASAIVYTSLLVNAGYTSVQHFEMILHDPSALAIFRRGHYLVFIDGLTSVLEREEKPQVSEVEVEEKIQTAHPLTYHPGQYQSSLPVFNRPVMHSSYPSSSSYYPPPPPPPPPSSYYQSPYPQPQPPYHTHRPHRLLSEEELNLLYEAVNLYGKTNPCRKGRKVDWQVIANNGMKQERYTALSHYTADELETQYHQHHELPTYGTGRNTDWTPMLVRLLWEVSQDTKCKSGNKTMWEQIAQGRTGVERYKPLSQFSNSQLRSRFRTEFGDKRPQTRKNKLQAKLAIEAKEKQNEKKQQMEEEE